jgi:hypothetical protein
MAPAFLSKFSNKSPTTATNGLALPNGNGSSSNGRSSRRRRPSLPSSNSSEHSNPDVLVIPPSPAVSQGSSPRAPARTLAYDDPSTPTPERPGMGMRHSSSLTDIRGSGAPPHERHRAATLASRHGRGVTDGGALTMSPPSMTLTLEDGVEGLPTIVDSPAQASFPRDGALLVPGGGGGDDARSVRSTGKRRSWMRSGSREPPDPASPVRERERRRPTGLGAALAASGMAIANPTVSVQHVAGSLSGGPRRSASISSINAVAAAAAGGGRHDIAAQHAPRRSVEGERPASSVGGGSNPGTDYDSAEESDSEDELDLDDDIPVTGFAVASTRRNIEFHEMFSAVPEGDYLIEGEEVRAVESV